MFKLIEGKNGATPYFPLNCKKGGPVRYAKERKDICLTEEQMRYIYKKVEPGSGINVDAMKQEIDNDNLKAIKTEEEEINPSSVKQFVQR